MEESKKCINIWHTPKALKPYCVKYDGKVYRYSNYTEAKAKIDAVLQSYPFSMTA